MKDMIDNPTSAVFIDGDWLYYTARSLKENIDYASLKTCLSNSFATENSTHFFCSVLPQSKKHAEFVLTLKSLGYIVHVSGFRSWKDRFGNTHVVTAGLDVSFAVSVMALPDEFKRIVLLTGDNDFVYLVEAAKAQGREVILITIPLASRALVEASGKNYINLESVLKNLKHGKGIPGTNRRKSITPRSMYVEKGDHFAPYLVIRSLFRAAKKDVVMVDPYVDDQVLQMIPVLPKTVSVTILSNKITPPDFCVQVQKLRMDGYTVQIFRTKDFHDRFLGVDGQWWHSGHSFKDLGGKVSFFSKVGDSQAITKLKKRVQSEISKGKEYCI